MQETTYDALVGYNDRCCCARNGDGSRTTFLCPEHAEYDPCATMALITGKRRKGTIRRGRCTNCGHGDNRLR